MKKQKNTSAQVLILAALAIALIISSTQLYIFQLSQVLTRENPFSLGDFVRIVKLGSRNLIVGLLADISNGGDNRTLRTSLRRWSSFVEENYYFGESSLRSTLSENPPYSSGVWIFRGEEGFGATSAEANFFMNLTSALERVNVTYSVTVATSLTISGKLEELGDDQRVDVIVFLSNEGKPALAKNLTIYYDSGTDWMDAGLLDSYHLTDFGNSTYRASFIVHRQPGLKIFVRSYDKREILVQAKVTCIDI